MRQRWDLHGRPINSTAKVLQTTVNRLCMGEVKAVTDSEFEGTLNENEWVLVDFWAPWCGPCKALGPVLEQVAGEREVTVAKVNTDTDPMQAGRLGVRGIPAMFLYHNGELMGTQTGALPKARVLARLDEAMGGAFDDGADF